MTHEPQDNLGFFAGLLTCIFIYAVIIAIGFVLVKDAGHHTQKVKGYDFRAVRAAFMEAK